MEEGCCRSCGSGYGAHVCALLTPSIKSLIFSCPFSAHGEQEDVSVSVFMYTKEDIWVTLGSSSITYKQNTACELACFLASQVDCLTSSSHHTILSRFGLTAEDFQSVDCDVMLAMVHGEIPPTWNVTGNFPEDGKNLSWLYLNSAYRYFFKILLACFV